MPPATTGRDDIAWGALPDSSEAKEFAAYLVQNGHHEAAGEFSRAFGIYGRGVPTHSIIRMICAKHHLAYHGDNAEARTYSRAGCAVSALIFVTALLVLHAILLTVR